jgi:hypothetical protein
LTPEDSKTPNSVNHTPVVMVDVKQERKIEKQRLEAMEKQRLEAMM